MALRFYNSLGRKLQPFKPIRKGKVKMYACGPTVWNYAHIGNFRTFVFEDVLRRYLKFKKYDVYEVKNITDVEDRIIRGIKESGKSREEHTAFYERAFIEDSDTLGIERAELYPHPTDNVDEMTGMVERLVSRGFAYRAEDGSVYFDVSKFKGYGALSGVRLGTGKETGRVSQDHYGDKKEAIDFALWKAWDPSDGEVFWETELGKGRPGWHIECSAMSMKYLGESFDIHTGGLDLKFPHHENEIAQSEALTGKKFVRFWLHSGFLRMKGEEMHKSVGNVVYLRDLLADGWDPLTIRYFLISSKYRDPIDLTDGALQQAKSQRARLQEFVGRLRAVEGGGVRGKARSGSFLVEFEASMDDDLNTPKALAAIFAFARKTNALIDSGSLGKEGASNVLRALGDANSVLGIMELGEERLPPGLAGLIARRDDARKRKDFAESDRLREELLASGIVVEDTPSGPRWKRASRG